MFERGPNLCSGAVWIAGWLAVFVTGVLSSSGAVAKDALVKLPALHISYQKQIEVGKLLGQLGEGFCQAGVLARGNALIPVSRNDLSRLAHSESERYFDGSRYAEHVTSTAIKLIDRQTCQFTLMSARSGEILSGNKKMTYRFTEKEHRISPPRVVPAPPVRGYFMRELPETLRGSPDGQEIIAGVKADCFVSEAFRKTRACYWSQMHFYGGDPARPVILKLQLLVDKEWKDLEVATAFREPASLDAKVFEPPAVSADNRQ